MKSIIVASFILGFGVVLWSQPAEALCNRKSSGGVCVSANDNSGWDADCNNRCEKTKRHGRPVIIIYGSGWSAVLPARTSRRGGP